MSEALGHAELAAVENEVPVGAVVISSDNEIIGAAGNRPIGSSDPTAHAEILAIRSAAAYLGNYRLTGATLYTTVEPCVMCAGAIVNARISRLVFGTHDPRFGAVISRFRLCDNEELNHRLEIVAGVLEDKCRDLIQDFFRERRRLT